MLDLRLYLIQRLAALVMVPLVAGHIGLMIWAIQGGLTGDEILSRTRGSVLWAGWYGTFVLAVSAHAAIGLRVILHEWAGLGRAALRLATLGIFAALLWLGLDAVRAVVWP